MSDFVYSTKWRCKAVYRWMACKPPLIHEEVPRNIFLPRPRKRALTLPLRNPDAVQRTLDQSQSVLMSKFPLEIRWKLYGYTLGDETIQLEIYNATLRGRMCSHIPCQHNADCIGEQRKRRPAVALLRTCRIVYTEAIEFLYSSNTFAISPNLGEGFALPLLSRLLLPQRLRQIRVLHLWWIADRNMYYGPPFDGVKEYVDSWNALANMTSLHELLIIYKTKVYERNPWKARFEIKRQEMLMFDRINTITVPKYFTVVLPHRLCKPPLNVSPSKCVFEWPEEEKTPEG
ncbi:hypothetical protein B0J11DRAFT_566089 [Dendryphion nanum]|uniref:DUF7730 domain-containing protein n=1 Tax=Dendryphion nanum TaxID=256645 RepID=A0A9P9E9T5_9PLEO|nr:hypothetical protein B0J11DRAFT_566089 [Dendryphion nanum]